MIVQTIPKLDSYRYIVVGDNVLIINPKDCGIALVIRNPNAKTTCGCGSSFSV